jgi:MgtC family
MTLDAGPMHWFDWLPPEGFKILLVLFLSFLVGLEREEHKGSDVHYAFDGVRTFPLIGLIGYAIALLSGGELLPVALGFVAVAGFLLLSYWHKLVGSGIAGVTSEMSALTTYLIGALVSHDQLWIATTLSVASMILLELKAGLEASPSASRPRTFLPSPSFCLSPRSFCRYCRTRPTRHTRSIRSRLGSWWWLSAGFLTAATCCKG